MGFRIRLPKINLGSVGKALSVAAPFLPGPWKAVAAIGGGMIGGNEEERRANQMADQQKAIAEQQQRLFQQFGVPALQRLEAQADPLNNAFTQYAQNNFDDGSIGTRTGNIFGQQNAAIEQMYGNDAVARRANQMYDLSQVSPDMIAAQEAGGSAYDAAIQAAKGDLAGRGFTGPNTGLSSAVGNLRLSQAQDNAAARRALTGRLLAEKRGYIQSQDEAGNALRAQAQAEAARYRMGQYDQRAQLGVLGINSALDTNRGLSGQAQMSAQGALGTFGGLQGMYQGRADNAFQGVNTAVGQLAASGAFSRRPKKRIGPATPSQTTNPMIGRTPLTTGFRL